MKKITSFLMALALFCLTAMPVFAAGAPVQEWELVTPNGVVQKATINPAPRINSLAGKTVVVRWNGKHNGDVYAKRVAKLLKQKEPTVNVIVAHEVNPSTAKITSTVAEAIRVSKVILEMKPDLVIANQAD
jgi:ABC-type Fe3+-hydroxamate transport system substrate-binding protein